MLTDYIKLPQENAEDRIFDLTKGICECCEHGFNHNDIGEMTSELFEQLQIWDHHRTIKIIGRQMQEPPKTYAFEAELEEDE